MHPVHAVVKIYKILTPIPAVHLVLFFLHCYQPMYATMTLQLYFVSDVDRSTCRDLFIRNNIHVSSCWYMFRSYAWIHLLSTCFWTAASYKYIPGKTILLFSAACSVLITLYKIQMKISCSFSSRSFWNRATYHFTSCCNLLWSLICTVFL